MNESMNELRTQVRDLLLELDQRFAPDDAQSRDASKHAFRLRFVLAQAESQSHAAVMQSPLHSPSRFDVMLEILRFDIDRARGFLRAARTPAATTPTLVSVAEDSAIIERAA